MDRHAAATSETDRRKARHNPADPATLDSMAATQDRTAATRSSLAGTPKSATAMWSTEGNPHRQSCGRFHAEEKGSSRAHPSRHARWIVKAHPHQVRPSPRNHHRQFMSRCYTSLLRMAILQER